MNGKKVVSKSRARKDPNAGVAHASAPDPDLTHINTELLKEVITELVKSVEVITDDEGNKKAVLDWEVWKEIVTILEGRFQAKTDLGHQLWAARAEILASGLPTLNREELELEIATRRGGVNDTNLH